MNLREKQRVEREALKRQRRSQVVACALECFCEKGIEAASMADIAVRAEVGEATLYRYFTTKDNLVMECGMLFWQLADEAFARVTSGSAYQAKSGLAQVEALLCRAEELFLENRRRFKFLHDLDVFMTSHAIEPEKLQAYAALVDGAKPLLCGALDKGRADGSIRCAASTDELYYTLTHTMLSLLQKLGGLGAVLEGDTMVADARRLEILRQLLLLGLMGDNTTR